MTTRARCRAMPVAYMRRVAYLCVREQFVGPNTSHTCNITFGFGTCIIANAMARRGRESGWQQHISYIEFIIVIIPLVGAPRRKKRDKNSGPCSRARVEGSLYAQTHACSCLVKVHIIYVKRAKKFANCAPTTTTTTTTATFFPPVKVEHARYVSSPCCAALFASRAASRAAHVCVTIYIYTWSLKTHMDTVHYGTQHKCDECDKKFSYKSSLKIHMDSVHDAINYACDLCESATQYIIDVRERYFGKLLLRVGGAAHIHSHEVRSARTRADRALDSPQLACICNTYLAHYTEVNRLKGAPPGSTRGN
ncbi:unnamed protein product [Trichogramma brassicae]|uniref:C2H2-type domain-containing protein n=1 Tax=Trichogramma brassicae TaxID=86971 RepID=A0A6H5IF91_9HYME|nr:unnamed protein product [Trichogramma brassicae]